MTRDRLPRASFRRAVRRGRRRPAPPPSDGPATRSSSVLPCRARANMTAPTPARTTSRPDIRSASAFAGLVNDSRPALLRNASASRSSASAAKSMRMPGSTTLSVAETRRQVSSETEFLGHLEAGREHHRTTCCHVAQRPLVGGDDDDPGAAMDSRRRGRHQCGVAGIITRDDEHVERADPRRHLCRQHDRRGGRSAECGGEHRACGLGGAVVGDPDDGARRPVGPQRIEQTLLQRRGRRAHLRTRHRRRAQQARHDRRRATPSTSSRSMVACAATHGSAPSLRRDLSRNVFHDLIDLGGGSAPRRSGAAAAPCSTSGG